MLSNEDVSGMLGWMSVACWIVVYTPQIIENYQLKSGDGLSTLFVYIWLAGDFANLSGAILAGLLPTIVIIAVYYTTCDIILLAQMYYYAWLKSRQTTPPLVSGVEVPRSIPSEATPLISDAQESPEERGHARSMLREAVIWAGILTFVLGTGAMSWVIDQYIHKDQPREPPKEVFEWKSQMLGWISAFCYLGARIPQILKNFHTKCKGLSLGIFIFAIAGNATYALSILASSLDFNHIMANAGWLAGSGLTVFLDIFVLVQFFYYRAREAQGALPAP